MIVVCMDRRQGEEQGGRVCQRFCGHQERQQQDQPLLHVRAGDHQAQPTDPLRQQSQFFIAINKQ